MGDTSFEGWNPLVALSLLPAENESFFGIVRCNLKKNEWIFPDEGIL